VGRREPAGGSKPSARDARLERQASELRQNLARRKAQSRARAARAPEPGEPGEAGDEDGNGA
jgi:hypothetical protein